MFVTRQTRRLAFVSTIAILLLDLFLGSQAMGQTPGRVELKIITLGIVAEKNEKEVEEHFREFVRCVARKLSSSSAIEGKIAMAPTHARLASLLTGRKADFYMESPYPTYLINSVYGAGKLLLRRWKGGMVDYHSLIFTTGNGETKRLEDLRGKIIAFEDPGSTSGYFLPKFFLSKRGFKLSEKSQIGANVAAGEVGYIFAFSQDKLVDWVLTKKVAAGEFSNDEKILVYMHQDTEGRLILQRTSGTTKFEALPGGELAMRQRLLDAFYFSEKK
jgi:ABC-type phosphate/phosphonate transport system substrate-binding protein